jgi:pectate lyase
MPLRKELVITAAAVAAAGALVGGVAAVSSASTPSTVAAGYSGYGPAQGQGYGGPGGGPGGHEHTAVTGDELTKVTAAVKAKDSAITVTSVQKDPDGSYDVHGTKAGAQVMVEVSKDLKTIEVRTGGPGGRGPGTGTQPAPSATTSSSTSTTT